jgi:hypothetical protein
LSRAVAAIGESVKYIGVVLGLIVVVVGYWVGTQMDCGLMYSVGGAVAGILVAIPLYLLGIMVSALARPGTQGEPGCRSPHLAVSRYRAEGQSNVAWLTGVMLLPHVF